MDDTLQQPNHYLYIFTYTHMHIYTHGNVFSIETVKTKYKLIWIVFKNSSVI